MKAYILVMTFFLANGQPAGTVEEPCVYADKVTPVYDLTDCHEIATDKRRKFLESIRGQNNLFMDLQVECKKK